MNDELIPWGDATWAYERQMGDFVSPLGKEALRVLSKRPHCQRTLRVAAGETGYSSGFIEYYLVPLVYPPGLTPSTQILLGFAVVLINMAVYTLAWLKYNVREP